jgi:eukaryotic-like serine/threonine-protein kinase
MGVDAVVSEQFGPYVVYERLGVGGMAVVHRAREIGIEGFERIVALKRLLPHLAEDATFIKSFVREAKLASQLSHNNIVQIFELGRVGTEYFISMEYIDGRDVRQILRHARRVTGPPPIHISVGMLIQLCDALDYAHSKVDDTGHPLGLVHRDVSPSNLLVTSAGHLKVIDFGIAKAQSSQLRTQTGRVKGKLAYMAPEAITGRELDARSDLWACGVIAHELLTARPLFASKNEYQTLLKVQRGDIVPPSTFNQAVPPELDAIVARALARDPDQRYADAFELRDALLELRRRYNLQTGHRDVAQWLDWAFSVDAPSGGFGTVTFDQTGNGTPANDLASAVAQQLRRASTGRIARRDDEEAAVDAVWGPSEAPQEGQPIVLPDVPDVTARASAQMPSVRGDTIADSVDDIPAPEPSHGVARRVRDTAKTQIHPRDSSNYKSGPVRAATPPEGAAAFAQSGTDISHPHLLPRPSASGGIPLPVPKMPSRSTPLPRGTGRIATTRPGLGHTPLPLPAPSPDEPSMDIEIGGGDEESATIDTAAGTDRPVNYAPIGGHIAARRRRPWWPIAAAVVACVGLAIGALVIAGGNTPAAPGELAQPVKPSGTVKFAIEPADVEITIAGQTHAGSPWIVQVDPGVYSVQIQREGYKARLATIELSPNETTNVILSLEKLAAGSAASDANLILSSTPLGLEVLIDGKLQAQRTPFKGPITVGAHVIALRQNGAEVWRQSFVAQASVDHEFSPSMTDDKRRQRLAVAPLIVPPAPTPTPKTVDHHVDVEPSAAEPAPDAATPTAVPMPEPTPLPVVPPPPTPTPAPPVPVAPRGPVTIPPTVVTRIAGDSPSVSMSRNREVPSNVAAKLCIDTAGVITSVDILTKLERHTMTDLTATLRGWRYAPYKQAGTPVSACFVVSFRVK